MLEKIVNDALQGMLGGAQSGSGSPMLRLLASLLGGSQGQGGGLASLVDQFTRAGLGPQMRSWISTGQNMPISIDQLTQVFGQGQMQQFAQQANMDSTQFGGQMADLLPQMIDRLTPTGQLPQEGIDDPLAALSRLMPR